MVHPRIHADGNGTALVSHMGTILLTCTAEVTGLTGTLSRAMNASQPPDGP